MLAFAFGSGFATAATAIEDLGTLPGDRESYAYGINSAGQVVGASIDVTAGSRAFVWDEGVGMRELVPLPEQSWTIAFRINDAGQAVGQSGADFSTGRAALWTGDTVTDLGTLPLDSNSSAFDINATGSIVGVSYQDFFDQRAVLWRDGEIIDLGVLGTSGMSSASALNDVGQVVGTSSVDFGAPHAFLWQDGTMTDLGTLAGDFISQASDINNAGVVVGVSSSTMNHAFSWTEAGGMLDLGALPGYSHSIATGINETGAIVGWSFNDVFDPSTSRAFLWSDGTMTDLGVLPGGEGSTAYGISDEGKIVGGGSSSDTPPVTHAVLWTTGVPPPVEPLTVEASATPQRTDIGMPVTFRCNPEGGVPPYDVDWSGDDGLFGSGESVTHQYDGAGSKTATCTVTDDAGSRETSTTMVEVFALPSATAQANRTTTSPGMPIEFRATATEGTGGYSFEWTFGEEGPGATGAVVSHAYQSTGDFTATVTVRDSVGGSGEDSVTVTVAHLIVTAEPTATSVETGQAVPFEATATGGAGEYTFTWDFGDGTTGEGANPSHTYDRAGTFTPTVTVTDAQGVRNETSLAAITVHDAPFFGLLGRNMPFLIGAVLLIVAAAGVAVAVARRKRRLT
jgi:probable HAF family extracellular repeat protein